jgi:methyltransferase family protein
MLPAGPITSGEDLPMKWLLKAAVQNLFSVIPGGDRINHVMKLRFTGSLPLTRKTLLRKFQYAQAHYQSAQKYGKEQRPPRKAFEFGAGTQPTVPLCLYMLGVEQQVCMDIKHLLHLDLLNQAIDTYKSVFPRLEEMAGCRLRPLAERPVGGPEDLQSLYGITYLAPADSADTGLEGGQFDLGFSTMVLEHVPQRYIGPMLAEHWRLTKPGGAVSLIIDLRDHYSYFDKGISNYNFLRYSPAFWRLVNSSMHFQNRLRLPEYREMVLAAGLELVHQEALPLSQKDLDTLANLDLHQHFKRGYSPSELGAKEIRLIGVRGAQ